ncbi:MAG: hypothetical protein PHF02_00065 [Tepidiphilus sp.]|jgi:hypothetical protein|nr:hypothetical protein [Tepidiphilus sp.]MDD3432363.1 hypothetical protein [Tepidiphilus sp.]
MRARLLPVVVIVAVLLGACTTPLIHTPVFETEAQLLAARGSPARVWENPDGTRTLEYATQPYGWTCWMYTVDGDGRIVEQYDALAPENLERVKPGMTKAEVSRILGTHRRERYFRLSGEEVWDWNIKTEWRGVLFTLFNVHFRNGVVERTSVSYVYGWLDPNAM